ncbi:MAG: hypothetical protein IRZ07_29380 [Microbispora sp.]|nr:hypothetical protein [Microbispora sp.]
MAMNDILCVQERHGDQRPEALPSLRLCRACYNRLRRDLADLGRLYVELESVLPAGSTPQYGQRVSGSGSRPLPISVPVVETRSQIAHDLAWWVGYVADRRGLTPPTGATVPALARWLAGHVDWIAAHPVAAEECPPVVRELAGRARGLLDPNRKLPTGERCRVVPEGEDRCTGTVTMVQKPDETWTARCTVCGPQEAAPYLHDRLAGRWVTIERVRAYVLRVHRLDVTGATVRSWAHRGHIRTAEQAGAVWYDLGTVETYLNQRHPVAS